MLLTLHNLPPNVRYPDVKALIQSKCGAMQIILDNLVQHNKYKRVTVGLADEGDAAIFVRKMNGLFIDGCQLYVEDSRQAKTMEQPYRPNSSQGEEAIPNMMNQNYQQVTGVMPAANMMPVVQMDPKMFNMQYGMYYMPDQNATMMGYNQQSNLQGWPDQNSQVAQAPLGMQGSYGGGVSGSDRQINMCETSSAPSDARRRRDDDWGNEPPLKQSRWEDSSRTPTSRDSGRPRGKSPPRAKQGKGGKGRNPYPDRSNYNPRDSNKRNPPEDRQPNDRYQETNVSAGNSYVGIQNVSYPTHLYSRPMPKNNTHQESGMDVPNDFNNPRNAMGHQNPKSKPLMGRPEPDHDVRGGPPMRRSGFSEESRERPSFRQEFSWGGPDSKQGPQERYNQKPDMAKGRTNPVQGSQPRPSFQQETRRSRFGQEPEPQPSFNQDAVRGPSGFKQGPKERPNFQHEAPRSRPESHQEPPNTRSEYRDNYNSGMIKELDSRRERNVYAPADSWDQNRSRSRDRRSPREHSLPSRNFGAEGKREDHHNKPLASSSYAGGNSGARPYYEMNRSTASPPKYGNRENPKFSKEISARSDNRNPGSAPRYQGPRAPGPSQYKTPHHQPRATSFRAPRPTFENKKKNYMSQPMTPKWDTPLSLKSAINKHNSALYQAAAKLARDILENLQLETKEAKEILKPLKKSIHARLELILGETMCTSVDQILGIYRGKFPAKKDMELFEAVLQKVEKGDEDVNNKSFEDGKAKASPATIKPSTSTQSLTSLPKAGSSKPSVNQPAVKETITKLSKIAVPKGGKVPKYPNSDKNLMKQQKQLGKQEYLNDDLYKLPELTRKVLDEELDLLCKIFEGECTDVEDEAERSVIKRVVLKAVPEFRKALKLQTVKRVLDISTNLSIRIYFYGKAPKGPGFDAFLKKYSVLACRKSKRAQFFIASVNSYADYDRVIGLGSANIDGTNITIKPLHLGGSKPRLGREKVVQQRKNFVQQQIANPSTQDFTVDDDFIDSKELQFINEQDFENKQDGNEQDFINDQGLDATKQDVTEQDFINDQGLDATKQDTGEQYFTKDQDIDNVQDGDVQDFLQNATESEIEGGDVNEQFGYDQENVDADFDCIPDDDLEDY